VPPFLRAGSKELGGYSLISRSDFHEHAQAFIIDRVQGSGNGRAMSKSGRDPV
jgi:hypothetical protein